MKRRRLLAAGGAAGLTATAGCLGLVYPRIEGRLVSKAVRAGGPEGREPVAVETGEGVTVAAEEFRDDFSAPLRVSDALAGRLREAFGTVVYTLAIELERRDPANGARAGARVTYLVNRPPWNAVAVGDAVRGRVARFDGGAPRLASVEPA